MKESNARRLQRDALEKKVESRAYKVTYAEKLRDTYARSMANNDRQLDKERKDLERAKKELAAFDSGVTIDSLINLDSFMS